MEGLQKMLFVQKTIKLGVTLQVLGIFLHSEEDF